MPTKPKRPCSYPGCPNLTDDRFCETHAKTEAKRYEKYDRDPSAKKRYNSTWRRLRNNYIKAHPLCEHCLKENKYIPAQEVHHVLPLAEGVRMHKQTWLPFVNHAMPKSMPSEVIVGIIITPRGGLNLYTLFLKQRAGGVVLKFA